MMLRGLSSQALVAFCLSWSLVSADPTDWVNSNYILALRGQPSATTQQAAQTIVRAASTDAAGGPWSVIRTHILPPSGDPRDYFSWAPYWWPDCSKCSPSTNNAATPNDDQPALNRRGSIKSEVLGSAFDSSSSIRHARTQTSPSPETRSATLLVSAAANVTDVLAAFVWSSDVLYAAKQTTATNQRGSPTPTQSKACPTLPKNSPPSATWTACTYVQRDGQVNPDTRQLNDSSYINQVSQAVFSLSAAYALTGSESYAGTAAHYIDTFFTSQNTGMNPNVEYGQIVRGPGKEVGSFMAILDLRGLVKVVNAVEILREAESANWTWRLDSQLVIWATNYIYWLQKSANGQKAANAANNHGTFFCAQMTALQVLVGDYDGARQTLNNFFAGAFQNQIVASGEQPFEAVRTRPAHYRNFNIEALIVNAKLADQLGLDVWSIRSKYGATIQTAVDFALSSYPHAPDAATAPPELAPHVATVAAAYGDPTRKYATWLKKTVPTYYTKAWWLWDQQSSFAMAPTSSSGSRRRHRRRSYIIHEKQTMHSTSTNLADRHEITSRHRLARRAAGARKFKGLQPRSLRTSNDEVQALHDENMSHPST